MLHTPYNHADIVKKMRIALAAAKHFPEIVLVLPADFNQQKPELMDIPVHRILAIDDLSLFLDEAKKKFACPNPSPKKEQSFRCKNNVDRLRAINSTKKLS